MIDEDEDDALLYAVAPGCEACEALVKGVDPQLRLLHRFERREPLVQKLCESVDNISSLDAKGLGPACDVADQVRAFVLQPSLDQGTKTGDKPGADSDHTQEPADKSDTCHLSSVVEQRFRKPSDSQELPQASEPAPGNAGNAVDKAIEYLESERAWPDYEPPGLDTHLAADTVIAEVYALREECDRLRELEWRIESDRLGVKQQLAISEAKLARVEALPEAWRLQQRITDREAQLARDLAMELEGVLSVEPRACPVCGAKHSDTCPFV